MLYAVPTVEENGMERVDRTGRSAVYSSASSTTDSLVGIMNSTKD